HPSQRADVRLSFLPEPFNGKTNAELSSAFGLALGGGLAPTDAVPLAGSNGLVGSPLPEPAPYRRPFSLHDASYARSLDPQYPKAYLHFTPGSTSNSDGWRLQNTEGASRLVFVDSEAPTLVLSPWLYPLEIHPEDVQYGYRVEGMLFDRVGSQVAMRAFTQDFLDLKVGTDGYVHIDFNVHDLAENATPISLALRVTDTAVRRGRNLSYFAQRNFCGDCATDATWIEE